jgi:hypothetical protein
MMRYLLVALLSSVPIAPAAALTPEDFARARALHPADGTLVQRVAVPADLYEWTARQDLGDVRVFNGAGEAVPYAFRPPQPAETVSEWQPMPVFALPPPGADGTPAEVSVRLGGDGAVVAVLGATDSRTGLSSYLVDAGATVDAIYSLSLRWPPEQRDFVSRIRIEASDDLNHWRVVSSMSTVARLTTTDHRVEAKLVEFPSTRARYLRLSQLDGATPLALAGVDVRGHRPGHVQRHWKTLTGVAESGGHQFDAGGTFPIDRIRVDLPRATYLAEARIHSRASSAHAWRLRGQQKFYRVALPVADGGSDTGATADTEASTIVTGDAMVMTASADRFWRVEWVTPQALQPTVDIGWRPEELLFLLQGEPPFRLAYGLAGIAGVAWPIDDLAERFGARPLSQIDTLPQATLGEVEVLGGAASLQEPPTPVNWTTLTLWLVLLAGVSLVGALAYRLVRSGAGVRT